MAHRASLADLSQGFATVSSEACTGYVLSLALLNFVAPSLRRLALRVCAGVATVAETGSGFAVGCR